MKLNIVGKNIIRVDAQAKVTGKALYPQDIYLDNMVYGKTVRSTKPHAYIKIDIRGRKGRRCIKVFTYKDIPNKMPME